MLRSYLDLLESDYAVSAVEDRLRHLIRYPGSPLIVRRLLRPGYTLVANELHKQEREQLAWLFHRDRHTKLMGLDGYTALKTLVPPKERRGVVIVDPPFEAARAVSAAPKRFASGFLISWFPIKDRAAVDAFYKRLADAGVAKALAMELHAATLDGAWQRISRLCSPPWRTSCARALVRAQAYVGLLRMPPRVRRPAEGFAASVTIVGTFGRIKCACSARSGDRE